MSKVYAICLRWQDALNGGVSSDPDAHTNEAPTGENGGVQKQVVNAAITGLASSVLKTAANAALTGVLGGPVVAASIALETARSAAVAAVKGRLESNKSASVDAVAQDQMIEDDVKPSMDMMTSDAMRIRLVTSEFLLETGALWGQYSGTPVYHGRIDFGVQLPSQSASKSSHVPGLVANETHELISVAGWADHVTIVRFDDKVSATNMFASEQWSKICARYVREGRLLKLLEPDDSSASFSFPELSRFLWSIFGNDDKTKDNSEHEQDLANVTSSESEKRNLLQLQLAMELALLKNDPVIAMQISQGHFKRLHGVKELCRFRVSEIHSLQGIVLPLRCEKLLMRLVGGDSLSDILLQSISQPGSQTELISTTKLMSRL